MKAACDGQDARMSRSARMRVSDKDPLGHMLGNLLFPDALRLRIKILRFLARAKAVAAEAAPTIFTYGDQPITLFQSVYVRIDVGAALAAT